jgi:hypothetical protein
MVTRLKPKGLDELLRQSLVESSEPARQETAPTAAVLPKTAREAVLETDDVQIVVYEPFENRP